VLEREKLSYLLRSARKRLRGQGGACPSCGAAVAITVARKYVITELRRCRACHLLYRAPTTSREENAAFYQSSYEQGFTTQLPTKDELARLTATQFRGTEKDYQPYLRVLQALGATPGGRLLDFGCSWGYGSWQLQRAGYDVSSFEISEPRCRFAREALGVDARSDLARLEGPFDVMFSAHVIEHVPAVSEVLALARGILRPGGLFVAFTPNGSQALRVRRPEAWMAFWGLVHPNFLDAEYYRHTFAQDRYLLASTPYDLSALERWREEGTTELALDGEELLVAARIGRAQA
jgi:2-polyprenyl-3-methyl-5-hydroxy-6-metoxy-1,4-benzoquinol methylase